MVNLSFIVNAVSAAVLFGIWQDSLLAGAFILFVLVAGKEGASRKEN